MTSPTIRADFLYALFQSLPSYSSHITRGDEQVLNHHAHRAAHAHDDAHSIIEVRLL